MSQTVESSPLQPCPDCGHSCSRSAVSCPNCGRPDPLEAPGERRRMDDNVLAHIISQSSMKIGMCLTLLGLIKVVEGAKQVKSISDELLAADAVAFLVANLATYHAVKQTERDLKRRWGRIGDILFTCALVALALICVYLAFELL